MASLLDDIENATGLPKANYLKGGRTLIKVARAVFNEPTPDWPKTSFRVDGEILTSTNSKHKNEVGHIGTMNLGFKFAKQDLARTKRCLAAMATSKKGDIVREADITTAEAKRLCGPDQPLVGAIIAVDATEAPQVKDANKTFTTYEMTLPSDAEINALFGAATEVAAAA